MDLTRAIQGGMTLAGAFGHGDDVYQRQMTQAAQMEAMLAQARQRRDQERARAELGETLRQLGQNPALAGVLNAGHDPRRISGYAGDMQEQGFRGMAAQQALAGHWTGANAALMGVANGPQPLAVVDEQNLIGNRFAEGGGGITTTDIGQSQIARNTASASASDALAGLHRTRANNANRELSAKLSGTWNPAGRSAGNWTEPTPDLLARALGTDDYGQINPTHEQDFSAFRHANPQLANGQAALNVYRNQYLIRGQTARGHTGPAVNIIDGSQPFLESQVTQGQQVPGEVRPDVAPPSLAPSASNPEHLEALAAANRAIAAGADRETVLRRLIERGLLPSDYFDEPVR